MSRTAVPSGQRTRAAGPPRSLPPLRRSTSTSTSLRDIELSLPLQLLKAREAAMARFRPMLRQHGLTEQQWRVVRVLAASPRIDASELARRSFLLAPSLTRILQFCVREQWVVRASDDQDQRRAVFSLTAAGARLFARVAPDAEQLYDDIGLEFGQRKLASLYALLAEFSTALGSSADLDQDPTE